MTFPTIAQVCDSITTFLGAINSIDQAQSYNELTEDFPDCPMAQVYPLNGHEDDTMVNQAASSFRGGNKVNVCTIRVDIPVSQRSEIREDMATTVTVIDAVESRLRNHLTTKPYFSLDGIEGYSWHWERVTFVRGSEERAYAGFTLEIEVRRF